MRRLVWVWSVGIFSLVFSIAVSQSTAAQPVAYYTPETGGIWFGDVIEMAGLRIDAPGLLVPGQATNLGGAATGILGIVNDQAPNFIEWGKLPHPYMNFELEFAGNLFEPETPLSVVQDSLFRARAGDAVTVDIPFSVQLGIDLPVPDDPFPDDPITPPPPLLPSVVYDPATGGITFENVVDMVILSVNSPGLLVSGQATDLGGAASGVNGTVIDAAPNLIEWSNLDGMTFESAFAGNLFVPDTPLSSLAGTVFKARHSTGLSLELPFAPDLIPDDPIPDDPVPFDPIVPVASYNPTSGGLWFENVVDMVGLRVDAPGLLVSGEAIDLGGWAAGNFGVVNDQSPEFIEWGNLLGMTFDSEFAGNVFAPDTPLSVVESALFRARSSEATIVDIPFTVEFRPDHLVPDDPIPDDPIPGDPVPDDPITCDPDALHALYDPATGGLWFKNVEDLVGLRVNAPGLLVSGEATDLDGAAAGNFGVVNDQAPNFIEWGNLLGMTFDLSFAGNIYEAGTPLDVVREVSHILYRGSAAPGVVLPPLEICLIPEPTALVLSSFALAGLILRRWRVPHSSQLFLAS